MFAPEPKAGGRQSRQQRQQQISNNNQQLNQGGGGSNKRTAKLNPKANSMSSRQNSGSSKSPIRSNNKGGANNNSNNYQAYRDSSINKLSKGNLSSSRKSIRSNKSGSQSNLLSRTRSVNNCDYQQQLSTETYTINMQQQLQASGMTQDSGSTFNIFGKRALSSASPSGAAQNQIYQRTHSNKGLLNLVSPVNSDLAGVTNASEGMIIDLLVQQQQLQQIQQQKQQYQQESGKMRQNSSKDNLLRKPTDGSRVNFPLSNQQNSKTLPSQQSMKIGIRKFEKNLNQNKQHNQQHHHQQQPLTSGQKTQSRACLQMLPENSAIVNQVIQKRVKPYNRGPAVYTKEQYKIVAQIIHFALQRRTRQTQPLFTTESQQQKILRRTNSQSGQLSAGKQQPQNFLLGGNNGRPAGYNTHTQQSSTTNSNNGRGRSASVHRDQQQNTIQSFGRAKGQSSNNKKHLTSFNSQKDHNSISNDGGNVSFGRHALKQQSSTLSRGEQPSSMMTNRSAIGQPQQNLNLQKEVDLRSEEIVESYFIIMRQADQAVNLDHEYHIYNLLAKISKQVATNHEITWSKALEAHFNQNIFKAKSIRVSQNFIFRKFFCKWLEQYLQLQTEATQLLTQQNEQNARVDTKQSQILQGDDPVHTYGDYDESNDGGPISFQQRKTVTIDGETQLLHSNNPLVGSSFGVKQPKRQTTSNNKHQISNTQNTQQTLVSEITSFRQGLNQPVVIDSERTVELQYGQPQQMIQQQQYQNNQQANTPAANLCASQYSEQVGTTGNNKFNEMALLQHIPSQQTLIEECADTIEGALSPVSQQQIYLDTQQFQRQQQIIQQQQKHHSHTHSFGNTYPQPRLQFENNPQNFIENGNQEQKSNNYMIAEQQQMMQQQMLQQIQHSQQQPPQASSFHQRSLTAANQIQQQMGNTQKSVAMSGDQHKQQQSSDMQKAIVTLLSQRTMHETISEALQQTLQVDSLNKELVRNTNNMASPIQVLSQTGQSEMSSNFQKKSLTQLVQQMQQSQSSNVSGLQRVQQMTQRMKGVQQQKQDVVSMSSNQKHEENLKPVPINTPNQFKRQSNKKSSKENSNSQNRTVENNSSLRKKLYAEDQTLESKVDEDSYYMKSMTRSNFTPQQLEGVKRGMRKTKRVTQAVRQRLSSGFLRFTYTDEWLVEAIQRWREYMDQVPHRQVNESKDTVNQQQQQQQLQQTTQQVLQLTNYMSGGQGSAEEEEEGALALVDKMLMAMQHRQNTLKIRCFSSLILHTQRAQLMTQMSDQMVYQHQMKTVHQSLFEWHRRFKDRQQRKNRLNIADGYFQYRMVSQVFSGWVKALKGEAEEHTEQIQQNKMVFRACNFLVQSTKMTPEQSDDEGASMNLADKILIRHVFTQFKSSYERIREFKGRMAEKMLRTALLEFQKTVKRQKELRSILTKQFREKTRNLGSTVLQQWLICVRKAKLIKHQSFILSIKRGGRMKKLIWKALSRNAKARKNEREEIQFSSLFFYQLIMKRAMKGFRLYKQKSQQKQAQIARQREILKKVRLRHLFTSMRQISKKLKTLKKHAIFFSQETHIRYRKIHTLKLWQESIENKKFTASFQSKRLLETAFNRLRVGTQHSFWNHNFVEQKRAERKEKLKVEIFKAFQVYASKQQRLRKLYLTQFGLTTIRMKQLVYEELKHYSSRKRELNDKLFQFRSKMSAKCKQACIQELKQYSDEKVQLRFATQKAQQTIKRKVIRSMFQTCLKLNEINQKFSQITTDHYKILCKGMLQDWKNLMVEKFKRRGSLLNKQQKFQVKRFLGKLRLQTQIGKVKLEVMGKLDTFRHERLKQKTIDSLRIYMKSDECIKEKIALQFRAKQLKKISTKAFQICAQRGSKFKFFYQRHVTQLKQRFLEKWCDKIVQVNRHRSIFSELDSVLKQKVYRALKTYWARKQIKKAQYEQCILIRRHFLKETAMNAWLDYCARNEDKRQLDDRKGQLADNIYLATIMHHWLQRAKKGHSVRAIGYLVEKQHQRLIQARTLQMMRIEFHKQCFVEQVNRKRCILQVQDIFNALTEYKNARRSRRELNETRVQILVLQRKRKVFQTLKMQHFLSKIAKPPMLKSCNRYTQQPQTPTLDERRKSRSRSRSKQTNQYPQGGALSLSTLSLKAPMTPINLHHASTINSNNKKDSVRKSLHRYAMEGAQEYAFAAARHHDDL